MIFLHYIIPFVAKVITFAPAMGFVYIVFGLCLIAYVIQTIKELVIYD